MKELIKKKVIEFYNKHKKYVIMAGCGLTLILIGVCSWKLVFVKYKIFYDNENKFKKAAMRYYEYHPKKLPKNGEMRELTLQDLYTLNQISDLYVPNSRKMCDVNASWVRVYNDNGEYKYITYLKCGKYSSRVDHDGPVITLNGDNDITVALGSNYEELGVKEVLDNKDGKIDATKVVIDSSNVNMNKIGTYKVTYTVKDSTSNKTVLVRNVTVSKGLTDTVRGSVNADGFYKGNVNNYVLFSGMLWRIVNVNEDGTVKLILHNAVNNLRMNYDKYQDSNPDKWLNEVFYNALASKKYVVEKDYCVGKINSMNDYNDFCSETIKTKVALLDADSYFKTFDSNSSSIMAREFALVNKIGNNFSEATYGYHQPDGVSSSILAQIRPVITVSDKLSIMTGDGTYTNPYKLNDYDYAIKADKINTRIIGEYLEYSGLIFRIIDVDDNVKVILDSGWTVAPNNTALFYSTEKLDKWNFNLENENNPGYIMNNDYLDYIDAKDIVVSEYEIPTNDPDLKYNEYKTKKIKAKLVLPKTYDLFSNIGTNNFVYAYIDKSTNDELLYMANTSTGKVFELGIQDFKSYSIKFVTTIKGSLRIESGNGTVNKPYKLK